MTRQITFGERLAALRAAADTADRRYMDYIAAYGDRYHPKPGFDEAEYLRLMRESEATYGSWAETQYGTE